MKTPKISGLAIYPIKSCAGTEIEEANLTVTGLEYNGAFDRQFMVYEKGEDGEGGNMVTQRTIPELCLIKPEIAGKILQIKSDLADMDLPVSLQGSGEIVPLKVHSQEGIFGIDMGDMAAEWFDEILSPFKGHKHSGEFRLARFFKDIKRPVEPDFLGDVAANTLFSDGYPYLITGEESLRALEAKAGVSLEMNRFRSNIVIEGLEAYEEDEIGVFQLENREAIISLVKGCTRCSIPHVDQHTAERMKGNPTKSLVDRYDKELGGVIFGQNGILLNGLNTKIAVGDEIDILKRR